MCRPGMRIYDVIRTRTFNLQLLSFYLSLSPIRTHSRLQRFHLGKRFGVLLIETQFDGQLKACKYVVLLVDNAFLIALSKIPRTGCSAVNCNRIFVGSGLVGLTFEVASSKIRPLPRLLSPLISSGSFKRSKQNAFASRFRTLAYAHPKQ